MTRYESANEQWVNANVIKQVPVDFEMYLKNPKPANTLGAVIMRVELYNESGSFVGYLPIYDSITEVSS